MSEYGVNKRQVNPPRWPKVLLAAFLVVATLSIAQGFVDVLIPVILGQPSFGFLFSMTERFGPAFFILYVFVHNLGLACLVPGYGFAAAWFEKKTANRALIGIILAGAVVASLLVAMHLIFTSAERFDLPLASALFVGESSGVLAVAIAGAQQLRGFVPTPRYGWALITPFRNLRVPLAYSVTVLLALSMWEAYVVLSR